MKTFNKIFLGLAALTTLTAVTGCQDDFDTPSYEVPVATWEPNTSILELKQMYWENDVNYIDTIPYVYNDIDDITGEMSIFPRKADGTRKTYDKEFVISGRVISSDRAGNVYKKIIIQDETAAIALSINANSLFDTYRLGQEIRISLNGMYIGKYNGGQQLGFPMYYDKNGVWEATFMPYQFFVKHMQLNGLPEPDKIYTVTYRSFSELPSDPAMLPAVQSQLVRFNNVCFQEGGKLEFTDGYKVNTNRLIEDKNGQTMTVRTSGYATFRAQTLPEGFGDIVALLDYYATSADADSPWQLTLNDAAGCMNFGNPTIEPGDQDNPYTVAEAVELQTNGGTARGWTTGYIVGSVAAGVEGTIESNSDIIWGADAETDYALVIGPTADCKEIAECLVVYLEQDSPFRTNGNLLDNPGNYGKQIWVYGNLEQYMGTWGITGNSGAVDYWRIDGVEIGGAIPAGSGTEASPYNASQIIAMNPTSTSESPAGGSGVWVAGYIVGYMPSSPSTVLSNTVFAAAGALASNLVIAPTADCTDYTKCVGIQLVSGSAVRSALNLLDNPGMLGAKVELFGDVMKYCGGPGLKNTSNYKVLSEGGGSTPVVPPVSGEEKGDGTKASPYNIAKALAIINAGTYTSDKVYIEGIVSSIKDINNSYKSATYYLSDDGTTNNQLYVYGGKGYNGEAITTSDYFKVGDKLIIFGELTNYKGNTPEVTNGSSIISINGNTGSTGGDNPGGGDNPATGGAGTDSNPYTVGDILAGATGTSVWSIGYIVGTIPSQYFSDGVFGIDNASATNILLAPTPNETNLDNCIAVQLPSGDVRSALNLQTNTGNLGKQVKLLGNLEKYFGKPGIKTVTKFEFTDGGNTGGDNPGGGDTPGSGDTPSVGSNSKDNPYTCANVIALNPTTTSASPEGGSGVWVVGYIVGTIPAGGSVTLPNTEFGVANASASNMVLAPTPDCTDYTKCIPVQLASGSDVRAALNLVDNPGNLGKQVLLFGDVMKYCGAPGLKNTSKYEFK